MFLFVLPPITNLGKTVTYYDAPKFTFFGHYKHGRKLIYVFLCLPKLIGGYGTLMGTLNEKDNEKLYNTRILNSLTRLTEV